MISEKSVQEVFETSKVEDVVADFVSLKRRGVNMIGLCPFHDEKTPSFTVSPTKNIYKCFGCGKGGNPVQFMMEHEGLSFPEAIRTLAKKYNIELEETIPSAEQRDEQLQKDSLYLINEFAQKYFESRLFDTDEGKSVGLAYFKERGFREGTIKKFGLGFASDNRDDFTKKAVDEGYNIEILRQLGLTNRYDSDFFNARVMFPISSLGGKIIAFGGRTLSTDKKVPKYINSPETEIYEKRKTLYGIHLAKQAIRKEDVSLLVEGYTDVISLHQSGIENVVSSSGTALTKEQIKLLKRYSPNVMVIYDGDPAGIKAALRGIDLILAQDMNVQLVMLPEGHDPDSYITEVGQTAFKEFLTEEGKDFILFKSAYLLDEAGRDPIKRSRIVKSIVESISFIPDPIKRAFYIKECSALLEIDEAIIVDETNKELQVRLRNEKRDRGRERVAPTPERAETDAYFRSFEEKKLDNWNQENAVGRILVCFGNQLFDEEKKISIAEYIVVNVNDVIERFQDQVIKKLISDCQTELSNGRNINEQFFINHPDEKVASRAITLLFSPYDYANWDDKGLFLQTQKMPDENYVRDCTQTIMRFKIRTLSQSKKEIAERLKEMNEDDPDFKLLLEAFQKVTVMINDMHGFVGTVVPVPSS